MRSVEAADEKTTRRRREDDECDRAPARFHARTRKAEIDARTKMADLEDKSLDPINLPDPSGFGVTTPRSAPSLRIQLGLLSPRERDQRNVARHGGASAGLQSSGGSGWSWQVLSPYRPSPRRHHEAYNYKAPMRWWCDGQKDYRRQKISNRRMSVQSSSLSTTMLLTLRLSYILYVHTCVGVTSGSIMPLDDLSKEWVACVDGLYVSRCSSLQLAL